jgi:L,D-peptidoglycan transpeptidase YkuD (ErfK/YbiS/YcfS/YnhG family)
MSIKVRRQKPQLIVRTLSSLAKSGRLQYGWLIWPCAMGRSGTTIRKREGDGATPRGIFPLRQILYRPDKRRFVSTCVPVKRIQRDSGWCDAPANGNYNRPGKHPYRASAERLWRSDDLYDVIVVLGHNDRPRVRGAGSAIFLHVARDGLGPTEGCVALAKPHLVRLLKVLRPGTRIAIG